MTDLNKVNFMSKERFDNLSYTNDDELYVVETVVPDDSEVVHVFADESINGVKTFETGIVNNGTTTLNGAVTVNNNVDIDSNNASLLTIKGGATNSSYVILQDKNLVSNVTPNENHTSYVIHRSSDNKDMSYIGFFQNSNGNASITLTASTYNSSNERKSANIAINVNRDGSISATAPTPAAGSNGINIATTAWVSSPTLSTNVVHRSGDETIAGTKTFNKTAGSSNIVIKSSLADKTTVPSSNDFSLVQYTDKNNLEIGVVYLRDTTTAREMCLKVHAFDGTSQEMIKIGYDTNNNVYTSAPTPTSATDNTTKLATTAWVTSHNAVDTALVHRTGDETIEGTKTFTKVITSKNEGINIYNTGVTKGTNPSSTVYWGIRANDSTNGGTWANTRLGTLEWSVNNAGVVTGTFNAIKNEAGSSTSSSISVVYDTANSSGYATAPTVGTTDSSNKIATTAFVYNRQHRLCTSGASQTTLWEGSLGSGNITLNQSYKNFDYICVVMQNDSSANTFTHMVPVWEIDLRRSYGTSWYLINGTNYWALTAASTETSWISNGENSVMRKIIGIKY